MLEVRRPAPLVLVVVDEPLYLARRPAALIELGRLEYLLDEALLVFGVEDLEALREVRLPPVHAQQTVSDAVESADPERGTGDPEQPLDAPPHLARRLVGEGDREDSMGRDILGLNEPGDAVGE